MIVHRRKDRTTNPTRYNKPKRSSAEQDATSVAPGRSLVIKLDPEWESHLEEMNHSKRGRPFAPPPDPTRSRSTSGCRPSQAKSRFSLERTGNLPRLLVSWRGHGCPHTKFDTASTMNGVSLPCLRWQHVQ